MLPAGHFSLSASTGRASHNRREGHHGEEEHGNGEHSLIDLAPIDPGLGQEQASTRRSAIVFNLGK